MDSTKYQNLLSKKTVGIVGTGGLGSSCAMLLSAAGIKNLILTDGDKLEETNLSRSILFKETDIGKLKVQTAKERLIERNKNVHIETIPELFLEKYKNIFEKKLSKCDFIILSADSPEVHMLLNEISLKYNIPYLNAGYIETYAAIGPLVIPYKTPCYNCEELSLTKEDKVPELNLNLQAASYGPVNTLSASIAVNETLRYFFDLTCSTLSTRLLVSSEDYSITSKFYEIHPKCHCATKTIEKNTITSDNFENLANNYHKNREDSSFNTPILDELIVQLVEKKPQNILDLGCGMGTNSIKLAEQGHNLTSIDISETMLSEFKKRIPKNLEERINIIKGDLNELNIKNKFNKILITLVIDHIEHPLEIIKKCKSLLEEDGRLILTIPHPFKDSGYWKKTYINGEWVYNSFQIDNYFNEDKITKSREDNQGNTAIDSISTYHRTLSTYFSIITNSGFSIKDILEPKPNKNITEYSANHYKSTRIPYFLIFVLK